MHVANAFISWLLFAYLYRSHWGWWWAYTYKCGLIASSSWRGRCFTQHRFVWYLCGPCSLRRVDIFPVTQVPTQGICTPATRIALWPAKLPSQAMSSSPRARWPVKTCEKRNKQAKPKWAHHYAEPNSTSKKHPP